MTSTLAKSGDDVADAPRPRPPRPARRRFPTMLLVIAVVLGVLAAFGTYSLVKGHDPTFRSTGAVSFDQPLKLAQSTNPGIIDKLSRIRETYIGLSRTDAVLEAVADEVGMTRSQVAARAFTSADANSLLLIVGAQSHDAPSARRIASALGNQIVTTAERQQTAARIPDDDRIVATVVIEPGSSIQVSPTTRRGVTAGFVLGLLVALGVLGLGSFFRRPG